MSEKEERIFVGTSTFCSPYWVTADGRYNITRESDNDVIAPWEEEDEW